AYRVAERFEIANTVAVLVEAAGNAVSANVEADPSPMLVVDRGVQNFNGGGNETLCRLCATTQSDPYRMQ
ncbi:hypothetical protein ACFL59_12285, partial [Planctomycetota bacterium]